MGVDSDSTPNGFARSLLAAYNPCMSTRRQLPPLPLDLRARLARDCERLGMRAVARAAGLNYSTLAAALAGAPVLPATARVLALTVFDGERDAPAAAAP